MSDPIPRLNMALEGRYRIGRELREGGMATAYVADDLRGAGRLRHLVLPPGGEPEPFLSTPASEEYAVFSPDGRWIAHTSDESGREEVYVRPYPGREPATQMSAGGGYSPAWSRDGTRIYFPSGDRDGMMVVDVDAGERFVAARAVS